MHQSTVSRMVLFLLVTACLAGCRKDPNPECYERDLRTLHYGFEASVSDWLAQGGTTELKDSSSFAISPDTARSGQFSGKFTVSQDQVVNSGVRAEFSFDQMIQQGDETFYAYSLFIPTDYQDPSSITASDGSPNWQIMGQWHDQPDECLGQSWDDIAGHSPPTALYYNFLSKSDPAYQELLSDPELLEIYGMDTSWNNVSTLALEYGGKTVAIAEVEKGRWIDLHYHIRWSEGEDGFVQAWINGDGFTNGKVTGSNMLNKASHYFKFGIYRNASIPSTNSVYYDDLGID